MNRKQIIGAVLAAGDWALLLRGAAAGLAVEGARQERSPLGMLLVPGARDRSITVTLPPDFPGSARSLCHDGQFVEPAK